MTPRRGLLAAVIAAACAPGLTRDLRVRRGQSLIERVTAARDGDVIELEAGDHVGQTALITQDRLTIRCHDDRARAVLHSQGMTLEGKAVFVVRGGRVTIEGLEWRGARVPAGNGAGIRFERGALGLRRCGFFDNEMGLLSANLVDAELDIDDCEFGEAPRHPGRLHHLLYVGRMARLRLTGSRFSGGFRGHLVKSRAAASVITGNRLRDGAGEAAYEIDLPNGGLATIEGNLIEQGAKPMNLALLAYGAEGEPHPHSQLRIANNIFVNRAVEAAPVLRFWPERLPADARIELQNNQVFGAALDGSYGSAVDGNRLRPLDEFER